LKSKGYPQKDIAAALGRSPSTISDELERNSVRGRYQAKSAQHKSRVRRQRSKYQGMHIVHRPRLREFLERELLDDQSPAALSGRLKRLQDPELPYVSAKSIRKFLKSPYGYALVFFRKQHERKRKKSLKARQSWKQGRIFIHQRPQRINERSRLGDAEGDFIVSGRSGRGHLFHIEDRKHRKTFLEKIPNPSCAAVLEAAKRIKGRYPGWQSLTTDNDLLFTHHEELTRILSVKVYFCHSYSSWEKGSVENRNREIRRFIPKGADISRYSAAEIEKIEAWLNRRFLKCLNHQTPDESYEKDEVKRKKRVRTLRERNSD